MPEINLPIKSTQDAIKTDTTSLLNEIALVKAYVDTLETELAAIKGYTDSLEANVGSNADAASSTGSLHAKIKELRTLVDTLEGSLGQTTDAANAAGTVHAKLKDIKVNIGKAFVGTPKKAGTQITNTYDTTLINITGKGVLCSISSSSARNYRLTIDGILVSQCVVGIDSTHTLNLRFETSVMIELNTSGNLTTNGVTLYYVLD